MELVSENQTGFGIIEYRKGFVGEPSIGVSSNEIFSAGDEKIRMLAKFVAKIALKPLFIRLVKASMLQLALHS